MSTRSTRVALALLSRAAACLCAVACTAETRERPVATPTAPRAALAPLPLPSTAFQGDGTPAASSSSASDPSVSRFDTRRIGASDGDPESEGHARYRGARVDLDLKNAELTEVFRLLSDVGHVNIVVAGEVTGTVTMKLEQVPWDQALAVIARAKGLVLEHDRNVIVVHVAGK